MGADKRLIIANKRARNRRKKALRAIKQQLKLESCPLAEDLEFVEAAPVEPTPTMPAADADLLDEELLNEDELVFVCRPTAPDFCTEFVKASEDVSFARGKKVANDLKKFSVRIPAFRETKAGFITYTIVVNTCQVPRKHFQLERRFSEFVAFSKQLNSELLLLHQDEDNNNNNNNNNTSSLKTCDGQLFQWELPSRTWFRVTQTTALEERRGQLEHCLTDLLTKDQGTICRLPLVRDFLMLDLFGAQVMDEKAQRVHS